MNIVSNLWMWISALLLSACSFTNGNHGPIITEEYQLEEFSGIVLEGSFDLVLAQADEPKVSVTGNEDMVERLVVTVENHELHVSLKPGAYTNYTLKVNVAMPYFKRLKLDGSGDMVVGEFKGLAEVEVILEGSGNIRTEGTLHVAGTVNCQLDGSGDVGLKLNALAVKAELEGSGDIDLSGKATELIAKLEGSGDVSSFGLEVLRCTAELDGSGDIKVHVAEQLHATLDGSGDIAYRGKPDVKSQLAGSGSIHPAD